MLINFEREKKKKREEEKEEEEIQPTIMISYDYLPNENAKLT